MNSSAKATCSTTRLARTSPTPPRRTTPDRSPQGASSWANTYAVGVSKAASSRKKSRRRVDALCTSFSATRVSDARCVAPTTEARHPSPTTRTPLNCRSTSSRGRSNTRTRWNDARPSPLMSVEERRAW
ncbi:hypothetical protein E2C01_077109 [Portunus trituberculatus]|uniref:Uncharacterized protein n=1 Tax=Portunus trituberculatus TaxID=210409 RepID=A0A5B7IDH8_PORTR|nr:hypothetical protein [Portunus trituberculatus]